jgi:hypothetical protein
MDSGLATRRWRPGMTAIRVVDFAAHMIGFIEAVH